MCGDTDVSVFFTMTGAPVFCNVLWPTRQSALAAPRSTITLGLCRTCGLIYNTSFDPLLLQYTQAYENSLSFSPRFQRYAEELALRLVERYRLYNKDIVEIGCGQGDFLSLLAAAGGNRGLGFDPSYDAAKTASTLGASVSILPEAYSEEYAARPADLVCCRHVLEHIAEPLGFMRGVRRAVGDRADTVVFFEVPNALHMLQQLCVWDIIYEHFAYFAPPALAYLFSASGFDVREISEEFGGQYLAAHVSPRDGAPTGGRAAGDDGGRRGEIDHLVREAAVFGEAHRRVIAAWREKITREAGGGRVVLWGAGSKGVTFSNLLRLGDAIPYIVDINPRKEGMFVAGSGQRIVQPDFLASYRPDIVVIMNAIYEKEIRGLIENLGLYPRYISI